MFKKDSFTEHDNKTCFIFEEDYNILLSKTTQEEHGNLFGLWTTDGEPVIHVVCVPNCCPIKLHSRHLGNDILGKHLPLSHIGDWSYPSSTVTSEPRRSDRLGCSHQSKGKFLDVLVSNSTLLVRERDSKKRQVNILSGRSPFKNLKDFKTMVIKGQQDEKDIDTLRERMKYLSIANRDSVERNEVSSSPDAGPLHLGIKKYQLEFGANRHDFKVFMFEEDYRMIESLVLRYPNLETGGDLFGLWTTEGNAVLHVVLGPGQDCKRTGASFYQDISYLKENGELLTQDYMLCHIGEWHSHHQLHLFQPSGGDSSTVIRNYPRGVCGFLLVIANILSSHQVKLSAYLYTESSSYSFDKEGTIIQLGLAPNAFKKIRKIRDRAERGKEKYSISEYPRDYHEFRRYSNQMRPLARDRRSPTLFYKRNPKPYDVQIPKPVSYSTRQLVSSPLRRNGRKSASSNTRLDNRSPWR